MTPEMHATLGLLVLLVNLGAGTWALMRARRAQPTDRALGAALALGAVLLALQILVGADFWFRGTRPADSPWAEIHVLGPVLALVQFVVFAARRRVGAAQTRRWAVAALSTAAIALLSYAIGEMPTAAVAAMAPGAAA